MAPKGFLNPGVSRPEGASFNLRFKERMSIRYLLNWRQLRVPFLVQLYYPLVSYIDPAVISAMANALQRSTHRPLLGPIWDSTFRTSS